MIAGDSPVPTIVIIMKPDKEKDIVCMRGVDTAEGADLGYECYRIDSTKMTPEKAFKAFDKAITTAIEKSSTDGYETDEVFDAFSKSMEGKLTHLTNVQIRQFEM